MRGIVFAALLANRFRRYGDVWGAGGRSRATVPTRTVDTWANRFRRYDMGCCVAIYVKSLGVVMPSHFEACASYSK